MKKTTPKERPISTVAKNIGTNIQAKNIQDLHIHEGKDQLARKIGLASTFIFLTGTLITLSYFYITDW